MSTRILIAEAELILAELLGDYLQRTFPDVSVHRIRTVQELRNAEFDVAIIDLVLADGDVVDWLKSRSERGTLSRVIVLTSCEKEVLLHSVLHSAVAGVVHKADSLPFLEIALRTVLAGGSIVSPRIQDLRIGLNTDPNLYVKIFSPREQAVLRGIGAGQNTQEIAKALGIAKATVVDHRKNIMKKLDLHTQIELVTYALEAGFASLAKKRGRPHGRANDPRGKPHDV